MKREFDLKHARMTMDGIVNSFLERYASGWSYLDSGDYCSFSHLSGQLIFCYSVGIITQEEYKAYDLQIKLLEK